MRIVLSKNSEIRAGSCRGFAFPAACTAVRLSSRSAFFGSFEVGNQLDCLSTPEKSPCTLPSVHSFSCSHSLSLSLSLSCSLLLPYFLYCTLTHGHATTLFFVYSLYACALVSSRSNLARFRCGAARRLDSSFPRFFPFFTSFSNFLLASSFSSLPHVLSLMLDIVLVTHLRGRFRKTCRNRSSIVPAYPFHPRDWQSVRALTPLLFQGFPVLIVDHYFPETKRDSNYLRC